MKVLVTGGFGFLGGRIAQHLATDDNEVLLGSRCARPSPVWLPSARVVSMDWNSSTQLARVSGGCDAVVHLAGMNARDSAADPAQALAFNGGATGRLMEAASRRGVSRFIYFSTAHVYVSPLAGRITEQTPTTNGHPYATTHLAGEAAVRISGATGPTDGVSVRLSNAFGPPAHKDADCWSLLINDLCRQAATMNQLVLRSSGVQRRDFIPASDVCRAVSHFLRLPADRLGDATFNLGGEWAPTVWEVARLIQARCEVVLQRKPELMRIDPQSGDATQPLDYSIDALRNTGFRVVGDHVGEIDRLLAFCASA